MTSPPVILLVEDSNELRRVLEQTLSSRGYEVVAARDRDEALRILSDRRIDLVITDLSQAARDTLDIERTVTEDHPDASVIVISDTGVSKRRAERTDIGPKGVVRALSKPFRLDQLVETTRLILDSPRASPPAR